MRTLFISLLILFFVASAAGYFWTHSQVDKINARFQPVGSTLEIGGREIHFVDLAGYVGASLPPVLFIHGASGNLLDQMGAYRKKLEGQGRLIFVDRPGHGHSQRGPESQNSPSGQGAVYKALLDELQIEQAVIVCHSLGCASAVAMAVQHPEKIKGLVFVAPATHSWSTGVDWHYSVASLPVIGTVFTELLALPAGQFLLGAGIKSVFSPNDAPDNYAESTGVEMVLRPHQFRSNARDVAGLNAAILKLQSRYSEIKKPTVIITGNKDDIVAPEIHSIGLERDIVGSELVILEGVGHKPDYASTEVVIDAIKKVAR